ncbi:hypothetical protein ACLB1R_02755 [Escherichia coli]
MSPLNANGSPSNSSRGYFPSDASGDFNPPRSIRKTASVCAPALRLRGHHQSIMIARITRHAEVLVITGDLPVGKRPLRSAPPTPKTSATKRKKEKENAIAHGRYDPEVQTNSTSRIFVAQVARLNRICRIEPTINNEILLLFFSPLNVTFANS